MACVAALAGSSLAAAAASSVAAPAQRSIVSASTSAPLALRRSFYGSAVRLSASRAESARFNPLPIRAVSSEDSTQDAAKQLEEFFDDLKVKWDRVENKTTVGIYAGGALVAVWLSSTIVGAINAVPLLPKLMELIGLGYTGWFVYRYLLFKSSRKELVQDIEELKGKITGAVREEGGL